MSRERHPLEDLTAFLDGALAPDTAARVREHLAGCAACRAQEARLRSAVAALSALPPGPDLPPFFGARLEARLREERSRSRTPGPVRWLAGLAAIPHPRLVAVAGGMATAALVAGVFLSSWRDTRAMVKDLDLLQDYETASALGVDTPEDALIVAQLDQLEPEEGKP